MAKEKSLFQDLHDLLDKSIEESNKRMQQFDLNDEKLQKRMDEFNLRHEESKISMEDLRQEFKRRDEKSMEEFKRRDEESKKSMEDLRQEFKRRDEKSMEEFKRRDEKSMEEFKRRDEESKKSMEDLRQEFKRRDEESKKSMEDLRQEFRRRDEESKKSMEDLRKEFKRRDERYQKKMEEYNKQFNLRDEKIQKKMDKLNELFGGLSNNIGEVAEDLFLSSFEQEMSLGLMTFDYIDTNVKRLTKKLKEEYDIVLTNDHSKLIVEVKQKFHPNDIDKLLRKMSNYKILFPGDKMYKLYGAVAGMTMPDETIARAKEHGLFVIKQQGSTLKILNDPYNIPYALEN